MKTKIKLNYNYGYKWYSKDGVYVKGYYFDKNNNLFENEKLIEFFKDVKTEYAFKQKLIEANGTFSVIIQNNNNIFIAVDKTRTFPLFYYKNKEQLIVTDDTYFIKENYSVEINDISKIEFLYTRYVTGKETILKNVFQVQAGEFVNFFNNEIKNIFYHEYLCSNISAKSYVNNKKNFVKIVDHITQRLIKSVRDRYIIIPLSSGYDSRLIVSMLYKKKYEKVICYTYGLKDSIDVKISKEIADKLGYKWIFIDSYKNAVDNKYANSDEFNNFLKFSYNHTSQPHLQDYFIVKELHEGKLIPSNAIFVPGHSGDMLAGSRLSRFDNKTMSTSKYVTRILKIHYLLKPFKKNKEILDKIKLYYKKNVPSSLLIHNFDMKERQSKYIINSLRVYEYFGYEHRIPLWDNELVSFFKTLEFDYKINHYFYNKVLCEEFFNPLKINNIPPDKINNSGMKKIIKHYTPYPMYKFLKQLSVQTNKKNKSKLPFFYRLILKELNLKGSNYESIFTEWILDKEF